MKNILLPVALLLSVAALGFSYQSVKPQTWEYKFEYQCNPDKANRFGNDGWELVSMAPGAGSNMFQICAFKRPKN
jgi:hypothetical protein